jgi:hypothetical protein
VAEAEVHPSESSERLSDSGMDAEEAAAASSASKEVRSAWEAHLVMYHLQAA